jgi:hypothetical protein
MSTDQRICSVEGCEKPLRKRGWCDMHYERWRRHGSLVLVTIDPVERFWAKVDIGASDKCWPWLASTTPQGYGQCRFGKMRSVHRVAYELAVGPIPAGLQVDHTCHNTDLSCAGGDACLHRRCCNPAHLEATTPRINTLRGRTPAALNAAKTHCPAAHPLSGENLYVAPDGQRMCRECMRATCRRQRAKRKAEQHA